MLPGATFPAALILLVALAIDVVAGEWTSRLLPSPRQVAERLCHRFERRLNRIERDEKTRLVRGLLVVAVLVGAAVSLGGFLRVAADGFGVAAAVDLVVLVAALDGRRAWGKGRAALRTLESQGAKAAHPVVAPLTRRPIDARDGHALARAVVEHLARSFDRRFLAPAFWYLLLGLPGLLLWSTVDGIDSALGAPGVRTGAFGLTGARLDDALNALPARLSALVIALAAGFLGGASLPGACRTAWRDARRMPSLNMGWPIAAMAGGLGLALNGPYRDGGVVVEEAWVGSGRARATGTDIGRALALTALGALLTALAVGVLLAAFAVG